jgi:hypothetical protein
MSEQNWLDESLSEIRQFAEGLFGGQLEIDAKSLHGVIGAYQWKQF